jgi:hypothetical protein
MKKTKLLVPAFILSLIGFSQNPIVQTVGWENGIETE